MPEYLDYQSAHSGRWTNLRYDFKWPEKYLLLFCFFSYFTNIYHRILAVLFLNNGLSCVLVVNTSRNSDVMHFLL